MRYEELVALSSQTDIECIDPFHTVIGRGKKQERLEWLNKARRAHWRSNYERSDWQITNEALYRGFMWNDLPAGAAYADNRLPKQRRERESFKVTIADVYHYVDALVGKMNRFRPGVLVGPFSNENRDRDSARVAERVYETYEMQRDMESFYRRCCRRALKYGECTPLFIWDEEKGPYSDRWLNARAKYGDKAHRFKRDDWVYDPDDPERLGDICWPTPAPWMDLYDQQPFPEECRYRMLLEYVHKEDLKLRFPRHVEFLDDLSPAKNASQLVEDESLQQLQNHVLTVQFWHRKGKMLPEGWHIFAVPGRILEEGPNPLSEIEALEDSEWGDLPTERMLYLESDEELHGTSAIQLVANVLHTKNKLLSNLSRNVQLFGQPKILSPREAKVSASDYFDKGTIIEWSGQVAPSIANFASQPQGYLELYKILVEEADKLMRSHPISSGTPPPGIKAGVALRLLEELEDLALSTLIKHQNRFVIAVARRLIAYVGHFSKSGDKRMLHIIGEDNQDLYEEYDAKQLAQRFNIRIEPTSNQARSPAARQQQNVEMLEATKSNPQAQEIIIDAMELVQPEKLTDPAQAAVSSAEAVYELCAQGKELPPPREGENYIVFWQILMAKYQRRSFTTLPDKYQQRFRKYMLQLEHLIDEHARRNPTFGQMVAQQLPGFPAFYHISPPPQPPAAALAAAMGGTPGLPPEALAAQDQALQPQGRVPLDQLT